MIAEIGLERDFWITQHHGMFVQVAHIENA